MCIVHLVELSFEFQPKLHLFFMVLSVLSVFFFQFEAKLFFLTTFFLQLVQIISHRSYVFIQYFFRVDIALNFGLEFTLYLLKCLIVFIVDFGN